MNARLDFLKTRRSVPPMALTGPGPDETEFATLLQVAARVPDHGKLVPWRFIVFEGPERHAAGHIINEVMLADYPAADESRQAVERNRLALAPLVVCVVSRAALHPKIPEWEQLLSAGAVCMNLVVTAHAMGFAASWLTQWYAYDRRVTSRLGLAENEKVAGFIHIGRSRSVPEDRVRPDMSQIVMRFRG